MGATTLTAGAIDIKTKVQAISVLNQSTVTVDGLVKVVKNSTSDSDVVGSSSGGSITAGSFDIVVNDALTNERALSAFGDDSTINCLGTAKIVINKNAGDTGSSDTVSADEASGNTDTSDESDTSSDFSDESDSSDYDASDEEDYSSDEEADFSDNSEE